MIKLSGSTFYIKKFFPTLWLGVLGVVFITEILSDDIYFLALFFILSLMAFGCVVFKKMGWDLADNVYDCGDSLLFEKAGIEQRVWFNEIINISYDGASSGGIVVVQSRNSGALGTKISFSVSVPLNPFKDNLIIEGLILRVDQGRNG